MLDSWQNSTPSIHHISIQFFVPFALHNLRFWCYFFKSFVVQGLRRNIGFRLIDCGFDSWPSHIFLFFFPKRNKKLNKNVMNWRGRILPTVQQKSTNFSLPVQSLAKYTQHNLSSSPLNHKFLLMGKIRK